MPPGTSASKVNYYLQAYSLVGLQRLGHDCLSKKMLGYNGKVEPKDITAGNHTIKKDFPT
ncbi:unnamed protein product [Clonostachys solani]|uniref:Uncharacterized protein n=1 Tax=Clonostachys solani TaxID=160281 RepID=A0A9N9ZEP8_9HYPO|nr:unnamed protein product [Clonostachys solani]